MNIDNYTEIWQLKDSITTVMNGNSLSVWELSQTEDGFLLEFEHIDDDAVSILYGQFPITADYAGEGSHGTRISLYNEDRKDSFTQRLTCWHGMHGAITRLRQSSRA